MYMSYVCMCTYMCVYIYIYIYIYIYMRCTYVSTYKHTYTHIHNTYNQYSITSCYVISHHTMSDWWNTVERVLLGTADSLKPYLFSEQWTCMCKLAVQ